MGAVDVGERLPTVDDETELVEGQQSSLVDQDVGTVGELAATAGVGPSAGQFAHLGDADGAVGQRRVDRGDVVEQRDARGRWVVSAPDQLTVA